MPGVVHEDLDRAEGVLDLGERVVDGVGSATSACTACDSPPAASIAAVVSLAPSTSDE